VKVNEIINEDCLVGLKSLTDCSVHCCVTSPPYYGLRDYGHNDQIGLEKTPEEYVSKLVEVFREVKRVLRKDGTLWLNLGDSYAAGGGGFNGQKADVLDYQKNTRRAPTPTNCKPKDLIGIPWMVAFALRTDGWYLRQDIIWHKPNPMPESVADRCTKSHEYIFLLSRSSKYYYNADAISEKSIWFEKDARSANGRTPHKTGKSTMNESQYAINGVGYSEDGNRNKRSVWTVNTYPYSEAHFATFPEDLIVDMIKAGCPENGIVLDPFIGAGTTALVAAKLNRKYIGFELNQEYIRIAEKRLRHELGMFNPSYND